MTSFVARQSHVLGMFQVSESKNQRLFKKWRLKSMFMVKKRKDCKASTNTAPKEVGAPHRKQYSVDFKLIFEKTKNTDEKQKKKLGSLISFHMAFRKTQCLCHVSITTSK